MSTVLLILTRASSPASLSTNTRRAAFPLQTLPQHRQHGRWRWAACHSYTTSVQEPQVADLDFTSWLLLTQYKTPSTDYMSALLLRCRLLSSNVRRCLHDRDKLACKHNFWRLRLIPRGCCPAGRWRLHRRPISSSQLCLLAAPCTVYVMPARSVFWRRDVQCVGMLANRAPQGSSCGTAVEGGGGLLGVGVPDAESQDELLQCVLGSSHLL